MSKHMVVENGSTTTTRNVMGYRVSYNEDEAIGSFTKKMLGENTGFSMGEIIILEIPFEDIRTLLGNR
jgi:hypothetical protein